MKQNQIDKFVPGGRLTGRWNEPRKEGPHKGVDIAPPKPGERGVGVKAGTEGTVVSVGINYGTVNIQTSDGHLIQYMHFDHIYVKEHQKVGPNTVLGEMGGRGPKGPNQYKVHVHIEVEDPEGELVDPTNYFFGDNSAIPYDCPDNWPPPDKEEKKQKPQPGMQG